ncbi:uncharacterized protein LOC116344595 [Contarinia nasturtii]|uniref:uncharacterized protein LOC116344595 n=1 Tax=Contarinia nasturtii TaxID=265458 RepID=UPI0012D4AD9B|nr:uncharacterized protein LOC116344595 [Contarinia nasturtii]
MEKDPDKLGNATLTGANVVLWLFVGPVQSKVVVEIGRAAIEGAKTFKRTDSLKEVSKSAAESVKNSASNAYKSIVGVSSSGVALVKDLYDGKDARITIVTRTKEALDHVPGGQILKVGIDFGDGYLKGESTQDIIIKKTKEVLENVPGGKALQLGVDVGSDYHLKGESTKNILVKNSKEALSDYIGIKQLSMRRQASGKYDSVKGESSGKGKEPVVESPKGNSESKLKKSKSKLSK